MAELGEANIGGRMVPAWLLNLTAEELDSLKSRWYSNPNLLDNWYFGNPVDQRGGYVVPPGKPYLEGSTQVGTTDKYYTATPFSTWYNITVNGVVYNVNSSDVVRGYAGTGYWIDRWDGSSLASITLESDGVLLIKRGNGTPVITTSLEKERFVNGYYTISVCYYVDNKLELSKDTFYLTVGNTIDTNNINVGGSWYMDFYAGSQDVSNGIYKLRFYNPPGAIGDSCKLIAVKLELGSQQTLAHRDTNGNWVLNEIPDYGEQLRRCQRYYFEFGPSHALIAYDGYGVNSPVVYFPIQMRTVPTIKVYSKAGTENAISYWNGSAEVDFTEFSLEWNENFVVLRSNGKFTPGGIYTVGKLIAYADL